MPSRGINKAILIGNLGADPELRYTQNGTAVCSLRLANSESWTDKNTGELNERTEWHQVTLWSRLGEIAAQYLAKGSRVYIEGQLRTRKWQAQDGSDRYTTEIHAREMQMLDSSGGNGPRQQAPQQAPQREFRDPQHGADYNAQAPSPYDDDIPF